jgi:carboxyl-terminal processing protease
MPRMLRRIIAVAVLLGAWALVGSDRAPLPLTMGAAQASQSQDGSQSQQKVEKPPHDLAALRILTKVILYVKDNYVDPKRVKPKEMMIASLEFVEKSVPDVLVDGNAETGKINLNVNGTQREFDISRVDSLWKMSFAFKDVFEFISKNMRPVEDTKDIEYAAVRGMLSTLDPHSMLLIPDQSQEMKLSTKGEFGGLGFVIQMREGNLTVVKVLPKTPAFRAGIQKDDQIKKIAEESTVNMYLNEAVSKLRGPVDSKVTITVERKGWDKPHVLTLTRATISIESVQHKLLSQNVGYVRLKNFQGNTTRDLEAALADIRKQAEAKGGTMKGLVLDLRGNPGGLLEQAIQVSDTFISNGVIVATVGYSDKMREEKRARPQEGEDAFPIAVLVNSGSASASEIVAGAMKNLNRAVIIGRQTFGKGSVQVLYDFPDDSTLKLTIAKYLTPGDISIQEVGIIPDIQLIPTGVTSARIDVFAPRRSMGEADLEQHFGNPDSDKVAKKREDVLDREKPSASLKYLKLDEKPAQAAVTKKEPEKDPKVVAKEGKDAKQRGGKELLLDTDGAAPAEDLEDQLDAESQDEIKEDFEVSFARDFVLKATSSNRLEQMKQGKDFIEQKRVEEEQRINAAIAALGVDWSPGPTPKNVQLEATFSPGADQPVHAGDTMNLVVTAENKGTEPLKRVRAWTESENGLIDRREFVFGAIAPGEKKSWKAEVKLPKGLTSRRDDVTVKFLDDNGPLPKTVVGEVSFMELPRPAFAFNWQVLDDCAACNGDGVAQLGEDVTVMLDVTNVGSGTALDSFAQIKNATDPNVFIEKGRFKLGELAPGETKSARFQLEVRKGYKGNTFPLMLAIIDEPLEEFVTEKLELPVREAPELTMEPSKGLVKVAEKTELFSSPVEGARAVAKVDSASVLPVLATGKGFYKVSMGEDRFAFVHSADAHETKMGKAVLPKKLNWLTGLQPPDIHLDMDTSHGAVVANGDRYTLTGTVADPDGLLDMYVLVNDQKVFFKAVDTKGDEQKKMKFAAEFALKEGNNNVMVVAREDQEFSSRKILVIRRRPEAVAQKLAVPTPTPSQKTPANQQY